MIISRQTRGVFWSLSCILFVTGNLRAEDAGLTPSASEERLGRFEFWVQKVKGIFSFRSDPTPISEPPAAGGSIPRAVPPDKSKAWSRLTNLLPRLPFGRRNEEPPPAGKLEAVRYFAGLDWDAYPEAFASLLAGLEDPSEAIRLESLVQLRNRVLTAGLRHLHAQAVSDPPPLRLLDLRARQLVDRLVGMLLARRDDGALREPSEAIRVRALALIIECEKGVASVDLWPMPPSATASAHVTAKPAEKPNTPKPERGRLIALPSLRPRSTKPRLPAENAAPARDLTAPLLTPEDESRARHAEQKQARKLLILPYDR